MAGRRQREPGVAFLRKAEGRRAGREAVARLRSLNFIVYANANLPLNWEGGMVGRGVRRMLVGSKDAVLFSCGLYSEERKVCSWSSSCWSARC